MKYILTLILVAASFAVSSPQAFSNSDKIRKMTVFVNAATFEENQFRMVLKMETEAGLIQFHTCQGDGYKTINLRRIKLQRCALIGTHSKREESNFAKYLPSKLSEVLFGSHLKKRILITFYRNIPSEVYSEQTFDAGYTTHQLYRAYYFYRKNESVNH